MAEVDTSSYLKPGTGPDMLETAKNFGAMEQQQLSIQKSKLDQANQALGYMTRAMGSVGPNATKEDYLSVAQNAVKMGLVPPNMLNAYTDRLNKAATPQAFFNEFMTAAAGHQEQINYHLGPHGTMDVGNGDVPIRTPQGAGSTINRTGPVIARQPPVTQNEIDPVTGQPRFRGSKPPEVAPGMVAVPPMAPDVARNQLPVVRTQPTPIAKTPPQNFTSNTSRDTPNNVVADRFGGAGPQGGFSGTTPLFDEGKKALVADQELATQKLTAVKPAIAALDLIKGLRSGPGTETWNKAVAFAKANGILPISANDPTAIYQEVNKYLNAYMQGSGTRSDADLAQRELSNPNVTQQINPALEKLTRMQIARDRIEAARANAFSDFDAVTGKSTPRKDLDKYLQHKSNFPAKMDETAFIVDRLDPTERQKLFKEMLEKKNKPEGKRFFQSLEIAKRTGVFQ